jgi:ASC-1-like (ASCH) protein
MLRPGDIILYNKEIPVTVHRIWFYPTLEKLFEIEGTSNVLPGIHDPREGVAFYKKGMPDNYGANGYLAIEISL